MIDAALIRDTALAQAGVVAMHAGPHGTAATFAPDGRVWGVRVAGDRIDVHLVAARGTYLNDLGETVQRAVLRRLGDYPGVIAVHFEDLVDPADRRTTETTERPPAAETDQFEHDSTDDPRRTT